MASERSHRSLQRRLMREIVRGAQAQEHSRALFEQHAAVGAVVHDTLATVRRNRQQRVRPALRREED
jgi:hypothetical protein